MQMVPLEAIAKQNLTVTLDNTLYEIDVLACNGCTALNITRAGVEIIAGQRAVVGQLIIPQAYENGNGNFFFLVTNDDLPAYPQFGTTQFLFYASAAELAAVRATPGVILATLTAAGAILGQAIVAGKGA